MDVEAGHSWSHKPLFLLLEGVGFVRFGVSVCVPRAQHRRLNMTLRGSHAPPQVEHLESGFILTEPHLPGHLYSGKNCLDKLHTFLQVGAQLSIAWVDLGLMAIDPCPKTLTFGRRVEKYHSPRKLEAQGTWHHNRQVFRREWPG